MKLDPRIKYDSCMYKILLCSTIESPDHYFYENFTISLFNNLSGPAIITTDGTLEYWINGICVGYNLSNKEFNNKLKELVFK